MSMFIILQLTTAFILATIGISLWLPQRNRLRFGLLMFTLSLCLWILFGVLANSDNPYTLYFNKIVFIFPIWIIYAAGYLIAQMTDTKSRSNTLIAFVASTLSVVSVLTNWLVVEVAPRIQDGTVIGYDVERGWIYPPYLAILLMSAVLVMSRLILSYRTAKGVKRDQILVIGLGFTGTLITGLLLAVVLPLLYQSSAAAEYSFLAGLISVASFSYAIVKHGLFDIKLAVIRTIAYVLSLATLSLGYFTLAYLASITIFDADLSTGFSVSPANIALALVLAFIFQPIKSFFDRVTDKIFFKDRYDSDEFIARLSEVLATTTDLRNLLNRAADEIGTTLKAEQAFFYLTYNQTHKISAGTPRHALFSDNNVEAIGQYFKKTPGNILVTELLSDQSDIKNMLERHGVAILVSLSKANSTSGFFALGTQQSSRYTNRDVKVLSTIADELIIAIQNSLSIQEVRDINIHLQQRIEEATVELRHSNSKLKMLDKSKDEFISMASHQLRTPLTAMKGYVSMVLDGDTGNITKQQRQVLEQAYDSSQRMVFLIADFLNVSRLQTGKFELELSQVDIAELARNEVEQLVDTAKARSIQLEYEKAQNIPLVTIDENKMRQVMMNFTDNAIFYSPAGSKVNVRLYKDADHIVFKVTDTGIGVPRSEQSHLFTKFFRATNARKQRPDGTGIGLYMAKKVIVAHGGSIIFESKEGFGSTFGFRLQLKDSSK